MIAIVIFDALTIYLLWFPGFIVHMQICVCRRKQTIGSAWQDEASDWLLAGGEGGCTADL